METKKKLIAILENIEAQYKTAQEMLHPSLNIYQEIKDCKAAVHDLITEIEEGKYDKQPEIHWQGAASFT